MTESEAASADRESLLREVKELKERLAVMSGELSAARLQAEKAIAQTEERAREKIRNLKGTVRLLESKVTQSLGDGSGKERIYTREELDLAVKDAERSGRVRAERAIAKTGELARAEIRKWRQEARRLSELLAAAGIKDPNAGVVAAASAAALRKAAEEAAATSGDDLGLLSRTPTDFLKELVFEEDREEKQAAEKAAGWKALSAKSRKEDQGSWLMDGA